jgi:5'-deoxynucleotidase YfbR-like HD superfamily hydrolase
MALVHDMAERLVGDITPLHKDITKAEKSRRKKQRWDISRSSCLA